MSSIASTAAQTLRAPLDQQVGTALMRQQFAAEQAVADLVAKSAESAAPAPPPGQGKVVDLTV